MSGKGSADTRTPNFKARREAYDRIFHKKTDPLEDRYRIYLDCVDPNNTGIDKYTGELVLTFDQWLNN